MRVPEWFRKVIQRTRRTKLTRLGALLAEGFLRAYKSPGFHISDNGEAWLIRTLAKNLPTDATVFDVGFNLGEWSKVVSDCMPKAKIYGFEISPYTASKIPQQNLERVFKLENIGLSDKKGTISMYLNKNYLGRTSTARRPDDSFIEHKAKVIRGDDYCKKNKIKHIHLLKIDVEGTEGAVLEGFSSMLKAQEIDVIQFEYSYTAINTKMLLLDFYELLGENYMIGKLFPTYVEFKRYERTDEDFLGPNMVAVRKDSKLARCLK